MVNVFIRIISAANFLFVFVLKNQQAKFYDNIITQVRGEPEYFRVAFYGKGFPTFLKVRVILGLTTTQTTLGALQTIVDKNYLFVVYPYVLVRVVSK